MSGAGRTDDGHGRLGDRLSGLAVAVGCVLFLGGFVWGAVLYQPYTVPTDSMAPTVGAGDRVLAQRIDGAEVRRGDVVVFTDAVWGDVPMVKRVVGVGGDKVTCCDQDGRLTVNGDPVEEPYLRAKGPASPTGFKATVPGDQLFLLGDHRDTSQDSRVHLADGDKGSVPRGSVNARVDAIAWPLGNFGLTDRPASFESLPGGVSQPGPLRLIFVSVVLGALLILGGAAYGPIARRRAGRRGAGRGGGRAQDGSPVRERGAAGG
ncbi:signal peptidase I [Streptomyces sp. H27-D2]|uniref:signal peptidase I n=1 Tax=Streptomyces sp. H27-D2 TaxID=3046304 RepID=UPI002DBA0DA6|nr:signal peptidase I [Streptomyces sp. H27-D2]MEC4018031.1 signal peptidase I [Streptomyces sp. H27-D2]